MGGATDWEARSVADRSRKLARRGPEPRLLNAVDAARYLGFASTEVLKNIGIEPIRLTPIGVGMAPRYDRRVLDAHIDRLSGIDALPDRIDHEAQAQAAFDRWKQRDDFGS